MVLPLPWRGHPARESPGSATHRGGVSPTAKVSTLTRSTRLMKTRMERGWFLNDSFML
ncbi:MAG: hypothetical protein SFY68_07200 [Candidatus Sumerlaeia bacterium]|nr:hypothetical protein [Candidatus Sumerlaeia bacterium]